MNGPTHTVGSHSDDRGGESDWPCYCDQNVAPSNSKSEDTSLDDNYQAVQRILLDWNNGRRPLSGEVRDILAWHKAEVANLLQVIEDEVIGRDILMDNGTPVNHTLHNFRDRQRQALKKIKERL